MRERPIIFQGDMVRAILDDRKTQTRRIVKPQPFTNAYHAGDIGFSGFERANASDPATARFSASAVGGGASLFTYADCPYGNVGQRLWVRETFRCNGWATDVATIFYRANERNSYTEMCEQFPVDGNKPLPVDGKWRPSIHMPRWASRITLEITDVRVEQLNDISGADAKAEGVNSYLAQSPGAGPKGSYREGFKFLWESINGEGSWDANPWVWAITFKRVDQ